MVGTQDLGFEARSIWAQVEERSEVQLGQVGMSTMALRCGECGWRQGENEWGRDTGE